jgi:hypothetical protein
MITLKLSKKDKLFETNDKSEYAIDLEDLVTDIKSSTNCHCFYLALSSFPILTEQPYMPHILPVFYDSIDAIDYYLVGQNSRNDIVYRHIYMVDGIYQFIFIIIINDLIKV